MNRTVLAALAATLGVLYTPPAQAGGALFDLSPGALDPQGCGGAGCWTNYLRVTDIDGDDDLDILVPNYADFFTGNNNAEDFVVYVNDGSGGFSNVSATAVGGHVGALRMIAVGDVDGDGAVDIYGPSGTGSAPVLFMNDGSGVFVDEADVRLPASDFPASAAARMADVDDDGDLDIFSADGYAVGGPPYGRLYINDGTGVFTEAVGAIPDVISGQDVDDVEFLDVDRDFDLDLFVNAHAGGTGALWLNDGTGSFAAGGSVAPPGNPGFHYNASPCDVDGDGDLDMWIENIGGDYTEQLLINDGRGNFTDETSTRVTGNIIDADDNGVLCADIDDDGDFDAVVIALFNPERMLVNDGAGNFEYVAGGFPPPANCSLWGEFGDLDGDGRIDLVTGQGECGNTDEEVYLANDGLEVDDTAPRIIVAQDVLPVGAGEEVVMHFAVSDRTTTDEGPRLARAYVVIDPEGAATEVEAMFMGGDMFRVVLEGGDAGISMLHACAEDRHGNVGCDGDEPPGGSTGGEDSTGGDPDTGADETGVNGTGVDTMPATTAPGSASATMTAGSASATGGETDTDTDSAGAADDGGDGGCSCRQGAGGDWGWAGLGLLGLGLLRRRRSTARAHR